MQFAKFLSVLPIPKSYQPELKDVITVCDVNNIRSAKILWQNEN